MICCGGIGSNTKRGAGGGLLANVKRRGLFSHGTSLLLLLLLAFKPAQFVLHAHNFLFNHKATTVHSMNPYMVEEVNSEEEEDQQQQQISGGEDTAHSKLRNNIATKGANSYYYAHAKKLDAPVVRSEPPQLVSAAKAELPNTKLYKPFSKFAWVNETKQVKVYVTFVDAHLVEEDKIELQCVGKSLQFKVIDSEGNVFALVLDKLKEEVEGAEVHKNRTGDKFRLVLKKKDVDRTWYKLQD